MGGNFSHRHFTCAMPGQSVCLKGHVGPPEQVLIRFDFSSDSMFRTSLLHKAKHRVERKQAAPKGKSHTRTRLVAYEVTWRTPPCSTILNDTGLQSFTEQLAYKTNRTLTAKKNLSVKIKKQKHSSVLTSTSRQKTAALQASGDPATRPTPSTTDKCQLLIFPCMISSRQIIVSISLFYIQRSLWGNRDAIRHSNRL